MMRFLKWLYSFVVPDGLLVLAALGFLRPGGLPNAMLPLEQAFAYLVLVAGVLLALSVRHTRILFAMVLLALADRALLLFPAGEAVSAGDSRIVFNAVALLLPLNLLALSLIAERRIRLRRDLARLILILLQVFLVSWLCRPDNADVAASLESSFVDPRYTGWTPIAQLPLLAFGVAVALQTARFIHYRNPIDRGFFWALVATLIALHGTSLGWAPTNYLATAGLILIIAAYAEIYQSTYYDELTGMRGGVALDQALFNLGSRYSVAVIDIDHMKQVNDMYGYPVGDQVLRMVATKTANMSGDGKAFRYEGNRFAVIFAGKPAADAVPYLEELKKAIETSSVPLPARRRFLFLRKPDKPAADSPPKTHLSVTISIGVAERDERRVTPEQVRKAAEVVLSRAKSAGGNQVKVRTPVKEHAT